ncbi:hypothetical protein BGZ93_000326 [Podila epicladia]|nr:hypothetical protein BGZ92_009901 [Podila epicladia]KAG0098364.1 hypothetical protein BGZ93_000326 [Podila epicladia]
MSGHPIREPSAKNSVSLANLRHTPSQSEVSPRKAVSHEGFQKSTPTSNASSTGSNNSGGHTGTTNTDTNSQSSGAVSAFSYLKARLFGSVADASTSLTSSARDLLQSKKSSESTKSNQGGDSIDRSTKGGSKTQHHLHQFSEGGGETVTEAFTSPTDPTHSNRLFSRTLPTRRQQLQKPTVAPTYTSNGQAPPLPATNAGARGETSDQNIRIRQTLVSTSSAYKHLSTGSIIHQEGFLNKKVELHSGESGHGWKVYRVQLKSSKLYFYKPYPTEDRPTFQGPKDHHRHTNHNNLSPIPYQSHHSQYSSSSILSPRLSITNECGMVLSAFKFESSTRTLLFEGNAKALSHGGMAFAPPVFKYVYGECFTEIDRKTMQFKRHVALLLFEDSVIVCKRKWIRYASTKVKDAIKFGSNNSGSNNASQSERTDGPGASLRKRQQSLSGVSNVSLDSKNSIGERSRTSEKQRGYFTKWKHVATYPLAQVEALDMASPVPSSAATFYPFAAPSAAGSASIGRNSRNSDASSIYTLSSQPTYVQQTTSTLELVITSLIDGKEFTHRLLFLPPSQEVRHQWYTKFNRAKELQQSKPDFRGRGSFENLSQRDTLSPRSAHSNQSTISLQSPSSPRSFAESNNFILQSQKMDRARMFCETTMHPDLQLGLNDETGKEMVAGASVNGYIHEIVFNNISPVNPKLIPVFATTYPLFAAVSQVLKELKRCVNLCSSDKESTLVTHEQISRIVSLIQGIVKGLNPRIEEPGVVQEIKAFVVDILQERLKSTDARGVLELIDLTVASSSNNNYQHSAGSSEATRRQSAAPSIGSGNPTVDLSNVLITGLTPALFLRLDPVYFAQQVLFYHRHQLNTIGGLECLLNNPAFFMRRYPTSIARHTLQSPLVFSMYSPHFLTVLITHHILIATQSVQSTSRRPKLLAQWIVTGRACRELGDQAGFMAIAIGVCSPGVVRLQETWKHVPMELRNEVVQLWIPVLIKLDMVTEELQNLAVSTFALKSTINAIISPSLEGKPTVVPCVSNIKMLIDQLDRSIPSFIQASPAPLLNVEKLNRIFSILDKAKESIKTSHQDYLMAIDSSTANSHLQQYFGHLASISQTLHDQYHSNELSNDAFESSLACEPHFNGQYLDYHYKNRKMTGSFIPLMFPEIAAAHRLFPLQLLLSLENTGNTSRKSSFDEANPLVSSTLSDTREKIQQQHVFQQHSGPLTINTAVTQQPIQGSVEWGESAMTHHGVTHLGMLSSTGTGPKARKRTYSFPPSRVAPRGSKLLGAGSQYLINMINPHLDTVAREWLSDNSLHATEDQNAILVAMQTVAGIGYSLVSTEAGSLLLKVQEDGFDAFAKAIFDDSEATTGRPQELLKPSKQWVHKGSNRSSLSVINSARTVIVKAGTLDMLLQVVVLGLDALAGKYVDERGDPISLVSRPLTLDHGEYVAVFFATYRSFCTAGRLLEQFVAMFTFAHDTKSRKSDIPTGLNLFSDPHATLSPGSTASRNSINNRKSKEGSMFGWSKVLGLQLRVLKAIEHWLRFHFGDFLDDMALKAGLCDALMLMAAQEESQRVLLDDSCTAEATALHETLDLVKRLVVERAMTPVEAPALGSETLETFFGKPPLAEPVLEDTWDADSVLAQLNMAALGHYLLIRDQEWFVLFEVLESQSADPLGWYLPKTSGSLSDEDVIITGIHNTLYSIRRNGAPGTHWNGERLINSLPMCLQNLCKLHHIIQGWVIAQIADPTLTFEQRVARIQKMLDVTLISRSNMRMFGQSLDHSAGSLDAGASGQPGSPVSRSVPSFVESAVASALISPESRGYSRAWHEIAMIRKVSVETLEDVLGAQPSHGLSSGASSSPMLVPSIGWLVERMLETCCYVRDMSYESPLLINFDKRQYVYDLVKVYIHHQRSLLPVVTASDAQPSALTSWLGQTSGPGISFAIKLVREAAQREFQTQKSGSNGQLPLMTGGQPNNSSSNNVSLSSTSSAPTSSSSTSSSSRSHRSTKIFSRLVSQQLEKVKRDQKEYDRLDKQIKDTQGRIQKAQQEQAKTLEKQIKLEQSRSRVKNQLLKSTLMRAMRPISLAITSSWSSATTTVSNATALGSAISGKVMGATNELMGTSAAAAAAAAAAGGASLTTREALQRSGTIGASGKPALVINLINSTCSVAYTYTKRDYVFKIVTEEGGQSLLQALDYEDMLKWIRVMNEAAAEATAKRRTLLDIDESLQLSKEDAMEVTVVEPEKKGRNSVFGVELRHLMSDGNVPMIVEKCITEIEKRGLEEVGIYRVPGAVSAINKLRLCFNSGIKSEELDLESDEWKDINVVAGALKQFLRELPEAVTTSQLYDALIAASALEDYDERLMTMKDLIRTLPPTNYLLLKRIIEHLERVTDYEEINHMYATNLAIVFGPTLLRPGGSSATSFATSMKNLGHQQSIVRNMILQYHWLFDVEDEEGEGQEGQGGEEVEEDQLEELEVEEDDEGEEEEEGEFPEILDDSDEDDNVDLDGDLDGDQGQQQVAETVHAFMSAPPTSVTTETMASPAASSAARSQATKDQRRKTIVFK